jgi:hypothetical protein
VPADIAHRYLIGWAKLLAACASPSGSACRHGQDAMWNSSALATRSTMILCNATEDPDGDAATGHLEIGLTLKTPREDQMSAPLNRASLGFLAAVISVLVFHQGCGTAASVRPDASPVSDRWRSAIWGASNHRPMFLGRCLGCCVWIGSAQATGIACNVGPWTWTRNCGGIGWPVHRPAHQGPAGSWEPVGYGVCALVSNQRVLGNRRGGAVAAAIAAGSI